MWKPSNDCGKLCALNELKCATKLFCGYIHETNPVFMNLILEYFFYVITPLYNYYLHIWSIDVISNNSNPNIDIQLGEDNV